MDLDESSSSTTGLSTNFREEILSRSSSYFLIAAT